MSNAEIRACKTLEIKIVNKKYGSNSEDSDSNLFTVIDVTYRGEIVSV